MKLFSGELMEIVLDDGKVVNSTLPLPNDISLDQIKEALEKYRQKDKNTNLRTSVYISWQCMIYRCKTLNDKRCNNYGHKGIRVCQDWLHSFDNFYEWAINNGY